MFEKTASSQDEKIDTLITEFREFKNKRKITELDLEKKILTLEDVFNKIEKNIDIIQNIEDIDALKDIKNAKETLRTLEDLTLADRLEIIENKESSKDISDKLEIFNNKIDLMSNALKIFDEKIKNTSQNNTSTQNNSDLVTVLDELSKVKDKISDIEKANPIGEKEFRGIHTEFEKVNSDFAELISGVREEIDIYDKKIENLISEIKSIKEIDSDIGKNENKYVGMLNVIKKIQELSKQLEQKNKTNEIRIDRLEKDLNTEIETKINTLSERLEKKIETVETNGQLYSQKPTDKEIQNLNNINNNKIQDINTKIEKLNGTVSGITHLIENEKANTNHKISDAMDAIKLLIKNNKDTQINNTTIDNIENSIKMTTDKLNSRINSIDNNNKTLIEHIMKSLNGIKTLKKDILTINNDLNDKNNIIENEDSISLKNDMEQIKIKIDENIDVIKKENTDKIKGLEDTINDSEIKIKNIIQDLKNKELTNKKEILNLSDRLNTDETPTIDNSEIETIKNESKTINKIQTKINKALKDKIDNLENKKTNTEIKDTAAGTKDMIKIITL
ncbi:MAG: hypothetical protein KAI18_01625, partial [Candidatus Aenigmarchaeota archaeon]|nr:hypothetical protein [Candidatus Aenigmarchaeota archaeon]